MLFTDFALKPDNFILDLSSLNALCGQAILKERYPDHCRMWMPELR